MLTTRNIFIANLAVSDIFLCAFTMPLTLVDLITKYWTLGPDQVRTAEKLTRPPKKNLSKVSYPEKVAEKVVPRKGTLTAESIVSAGSFNSSLLMLPPMLIFIVHIFFVSPPCVGSFITEF
jgi:hypothetical protein